MKKLTSLAVATTMFLFNFSYSVARESYNCRVPSRYVWDNKASKRPKIRVPQPSSAHQDTIPWAGQLVVPQQRGETKWCRTKNAEKS